MTGGVSLFDIDRKAEIAFPFVYRTFDENDWKDVYVGAQYKRFLEYKMVFIYRSLLELEVSEV